MSNKVRELQLMQLEILKDVTKFCDEKNLTYCMDRTNIENIYLTGVDYASDGHFWEDSNGEFDRQMLNVHKQYYDMIVAMNKHCKIWMCSPDSKIDHFEFTDKFNKER